MQCSSNKTRNSVQRHPKRLLSLMQQPAVHPCDCHPEAADIVSLSHTTLATEEQVRVLRRQAEHLPWSGLWLLQSCVLPCWRMHTCPTNGILQGRAHCQTMEAHRVAQLMQIAFLRRVLNLRIQATDTRPTTDQYLRTISARNAWHYRYLGLHPGLAIKVLYVLSLHHCTMTTTTSYQTNAGTCKAAYKHLTCVARANCSFPAFICTVIATCSLRASRSRRVRRMEASLPLPSSLNRQGQCK